MRSLGIIAFALAFSVAGCSQSDSKAPAAVPTMLDHAIMLYREGKTPAAIAVIDKVLADNPQNSMAYQLLGNIQTDLHQFDEAMMNYQKAISLNPESAAIHNSLGILETKRGNMQAAVNHFMLATQKDPTFVPAYANLADMSLAGNQIDMAIGLYQRALTLDPNYEPARTKLAQIIELAKQKIEEEAAANGE